ncbi:hypothetical protein GRI39_01865 [Altererythrobacter indicus]|uniref:Uncharacterized protein n=1 Tax=Altericroceibacterium indicum TaxID=374177 RepID=A0A845A3G9_9SPHN|nr:hypothetical protein [Altericroceibacterium indicum]MXP24792.1 hypothetical protein [Altericroceibacterium indicum]
MLKVSKETFENIIATATGIESDPTEERDLEYSYDIFNSNEDGRQLAFISYKDGEVAGYYIDESLAQ